MTSLQLRRECSNIRATQVLNHGYHGYKVPNYGLVSQLVPSDSLMLPFESIRWKKLLSEADALVIPCLLHPHFLPTCS